MRYGGFLSDSMKCVTRYRHPLSTCCGFGSHEKTVKNVDVCVPLDVYPCQCCRLRLNPAETTVTSSASLGFRFANQSGIETKGASFDFLDVTHQFIEHEAVVGGQVALENNNGYALYGSDTPLANAAALRKCAVGVNAPGHSRGHTEIRFRPSPLAL